MRRPALLCALALYAGVAAGAEYRSIAEHGAILYDAPSNRASKLYVVSRDLPVEIIATDGTWTKVRDSTGGLAWVERKSLGDKRTVIVMAPVANVRERTDEHSPAVFQVEQGVLLELVELSGAWVRVKHADGATGYVRLQQVWGI
jgi:SH3-like domain-containing protein